MVGIFENTQQNSWPSKTPYWDFLAVNKGFLCVFKNTDQNNIYASIIFKAKTKQKYEENFFKGFYSKLKNFGGQPDFFFLNFFST